MSTPKDSSSPAGNVPSLSEGWLQPAVVMALAIPEVSDIPLTAGAIATIGIPSQRRVALIVWRPIGTGATIRLGFDENDMTYAITMPTDGTPVVLSIDVYYSLVPYGIFALSDVDVTVRVHDIKNHG